MEQKVVRLLESAVEEAIAQALEHYVERLPFEPEGHTLHAMAKSAVTVYEAVADCNRQSRRPE